MGKSGREWIEWPVAAGAGVEAGVKGQTSSDRVRIGVLAKACHVLFSCTPLARLKFFNVFVKVM